MKRDIVVVGAGLGGAIAAAVLSRAGFDVVAVDRHATYPPDFRAEQLVGPQTDALTRLGLLDGIVGPAICFPAAATFHRGKIVEKARAPHYGLRYEQMVNNARALAAGATFLTGRVERVRTGPDSQFVHLADGRVLEARLVVMASGPNSDDLLSSLGITRAALSENHSVTFGFDVHTALRGVVVAYGEQAGDRIDYLTAFPMGHTVRANLFCYRDAADPWVKAFKAEPKQTLLGVLPTIEQAIGPFDVVGKIQVRPNSIRRAQNVRQDGIILIGDAYQSSCPAVGSGVGRILADVEALKQFTPAWFASPGMGAEKVAQFYDDPTRRGIDEKAVEYARYRRALCSETSWAWRAHRELFQQARRLRAMVHEATRRGPPTMGGAVMGNPA